MAEYRIVATLDPAGVTAGKEQVKQALTQVDTAAAATAANVGKAFDSAAFDKSIGALINRIDALDKGIAGLAGQAASLASSNSALGSSLDKMAASAGKSSAATEKVDASTKKATVSQSALDAAMRRVLTATDAEAAELQKLNSVLTDAKTLLDAGVISSEKYAEVQQIVAQAGANGTKSAGQQRQGVLQLGEQFRQFATEVSLGINPVVAFTQQSGQAAFALTNFGGKLGKVGEFLASFSGTALLIAISVLGSFVVEMAKSSSAVDEAVDKLKKDAEQTAINNEAKARFKTTVEGVAAAIRESTEATKKAIDASKDSAEQANLEAHQNLNLELSIRKATAAKLAQAIANERSTNTAGSGGVAGTGTEIQGLAAGRVSTLQDQLNTENGLIAQAEARVVQTQVDLANEAAARIVDPVKRINDLYDRQVAAANATAVATGKVGKALTDQIVAINEHRKAALADAEAQEHLAKSGGTLTTFLSPVSGGRISSAFGARESGRGEAGTHTHQGEDFAVPVGTAVRAPASGTVDVAGQRSGYGNAIYINFGGGTTARFGHLSKFNVKPGDTVNAGDIIGYSGGAAGADGSGDSTGPHLHYEVRRNGKAVDPATGKFLTDSGKADDDANTLADKQRKADAEAAKKAAALTDQKNDFVQGVVDNAAARGLGSQDATVNGQIDKALAEYKRRFNEDATPEAKKKIADALTSAEARETARHFKEAYLDPLDLLQKLQGTTGESREVLNKQLAESTRLGRELTPVEKQQIENSVKQGDALKLQASILEDVRKPLDDYTKQVEALNALLASGSINQTEYNARIAALGSDARSLVGALPGVDSKGKNFSDLAATASAKADAATTTAKIASTDPKEFEKIGTTQADAEKAVQTKLNQDLQKIMDARKDIQLGSAQDIADGLLQIAEDGVGKSSAIYKGIFVVEKAVAIARSIVAIQTGIAQAAATGPFPANLAAIASVVAATASIVSNISAVKLNLADGGFVSGPGSSKSDSIPANLSNGEFVVNAAATRQHRDVLEAINSGRRLADGGYVQPNSVSDIVSASAMNRAPTAANDRAPVVAAGDTYAISVGDVIVNGNTGGDDGTIIGQNVKAAIQSIVKDQIATEKRAGGALTKTRASVMAG